MINESQGQKAREIDTAKSCTERTEDSCVIGRGHLENNQRTSFVKV